MRSRNQTAEWIRNLGSTPVSVFPALETSVVRTDELQKRTDVYGQTLNDSDDMSLDECLVPSEDQCEIVNRIRKAKDKSEAARMRRSLLPEICISATITSRIRGISEERRIINYNSVVVLDVEDVQDADGAKQLLSTLPFVYYAGLNTFGTGLDVIIPVETKQWSEHGKYFQAAKAAVEALGFKVGSNGESAASTIYQSFDPNPYRNNNCKAFCLPGKGDSEGMTQEITIYQVLPKSRFMMKAVVFS